MPYVITTTTVHRPMPGMTVPTVTTLAVATLDDSHLDGKRLDGARRVANGIVLEAMPHGADVSAEWKAANNAAVDLPESGGTIALPDGTEIKVEPETFMVWQETDGWWSSPVRQTEELTTADVYGSFATRLEAERAACDAFNGAQA